MKGATFFEVGYYQTRKYGQGTGGDAFLSRKTPDGRIVTVLSDGLGSGIKAGVLATLTASMAVTFIADDIPVRRAADRIMRTLPVCRERGISYATFTIVDIDTMDRVKIVEYENPPYILVREMIQVEPIKTPVPVLASAERAKKARPINPSLQREAVMQYSEYEARAGDRLIFFSDGIPQSGMGTRAKPLGWGNPAVQDFALSCVARHPRVSARELARRMVTEAEGNDSWKAKDDISCAVIYFREPRKLLVMTGPSVEPERDRDMAELFENFPGKRLLCGGTTAMILSRELGRKVQVSLKNRDPDIPPAGSMEGAELVTEGIITLGKAAELLESGYSGQPVRENPATRVVDLFLDSDQIEFVVGTRINDAHQDPNMPVELEIRRNIVKKIAALLEEHHLKETSIRFI